MDIKGKRILVTGASRGLGRTLAFAFAEAGAAQVLAGTRRQEDSESILNEAEKMNLPITPMQLDVTSDDDVAAVAAIGTFDILVNNAGVAGFGNPVEMDFVCCARNLKLTTLARFEWSAQLLLE